MTLLESAPPEPHENETEAPRNFPLVALLFAAFGVLAASYGVGVAASWLPFNSGAWVVGEEVALRGWLAYLLSAIVQIATAFGLWRHSRWARWVAFFLIAIGLLPTFPAISAAVVDLRIAGIALWGALIALRAAALYVLVSAN